MQLLVLAWLLFLPRKLTQDLPHLGSSKFQTIVKHVCFGLWKTTYIFIIALLAWMKIWAYG